MLYLVNRRSSGSIRGFLESRWAEDLASRIRVLTYQDLLALREIPARPMLFTDYELFTRSQPAVVRDLWARARAAGVRCLNDPHRVLTRKHLLQTLFEAGVNGFRAVSALDSLDGLRYPVFVRQANEHTGALTRLLPTRRQLDRSLRLLTAFGGYSREGLLVVEFVDTRTPGGLYRKYSTFRIGERFLPRSVVSGTHWMVKRSGLVVDEELAAEELRFLKEDPHRSEFPRIFDLAGITYGRADYGVLDGRVQVWEINTNPQPGPRPLSHGGVPPDRQPDWPLRRAAKEWFFRSFREALREIDAAGDVGVLPWSVEAGLVGRLRSEEAALRRRHARQEFLLGLRSRGPLRRGVRWLAGRGKN